MVANLSSSSLLLFYFRVVIQPWLRLTYLNISYNKLTQIDDSLQVLPVLKEVIIMIILMILILILSVVKY